MKDKKTLDIPAIFKSDADEITKARERAIQVHHTGDIKAAGNEVEETVRRYFKRMLPRRYYVTQGHLVDVEERVSSQLDIIISDNFNIPSLMTLNDGTEYVPIDSVYAIGEIKSTYYKSQRYIEEFSGVLQDIRERLFHEEIINTAHDGARSEALLRDVFLAKGNKILNRIFTFMFFVDGGDFKFEDVSEFYTTRETRYL